MKNAQIPAANAEALAANFQVAELEPRLENAWAGGTTEVEQEAPDCAATGTCNYDN